MSQTSDKERFRLLSEEVQSLLLKGVIEEIPPKLVNLVVPNKSEKFPGSQRNWDMEISIRKVQFGGQHTLPSFYIIGRSSPQMCGFCQ
jgi:hypothetical protein